MTYPTCWGQVVEEVGKYQEVNGESAVAIGDYRMQDCQGC
jgi:hypothetical protein